MSLLLVAAIIFTSFLTAAISSMFGMLGGLILLAVLVNIMPVGEAMVLHGFIQLTSNGFRLWLNRQHVQWAIVGFFIIGGVVALSALAFVAFVPSRIMLLMALGLMPYLSLIIPKSWTLDATKKPVATLAGGLIVMINLLSGVAGPLLDVFFQKTALTRHQVVATKAGVASLSHVAKIVFFGALVSAGTTWPAPGLLLLAMLAALIGTRIGKLALDRMNDALFFTWTQRILLVLGALLIGRAGFLMLSPA